MMDFIRKFIRSSFFRYLIVGGSSFCLDYGIFYYLHIYIGIFEVYANVVAIFIAFWYNFFLNRLWSFASKEPIFKQLTFYLALMAFNMCFSSGFIYFFCRFTSLDSKISKIIAMCMIVFWNFILYKKVIFKNKKI